MSFQVGDKVRIKSWVEIQKTLNLDSDFHYKWRGEDFYIYFADDMEKLCGNEVIIADYNEDRNDYQIYDRKGDDWWFVEDWFEKPKPEPESIYVSSFDENEADVTKTFLEEILSTSEAIENCTKYSCNDCPKAYEDCVVFKIRDAIRTYQKSWR